MSSIQNKTDLSDTRYKQMLETPVPRLVTRMAAPAVATQLISVIYNTADTYFVARLHTSAAAAVGVVFALMSIIQSFGFGLGMGTKSLVSRRLGEKNEDAAMRSANSALFASFILGGILTLFGLCFMSPLLRLLGATETILVYARDYTRWILLGAPLLCATCVLADILHGEGQIKMALYGILPGMVLNIILDPLLIYGLDMGISGAAIATLICLLLDFLVLFVYFLLGKSIVKLSLKWISFDIREYWLIFSTGLPTVCRQGLGSVSSAVLNTLSANYGDAAVAAITIANKIYMLIRAIILGLGQGMQPIAGYNYGAKHNERVKEVFDFSVRTGTILCTSVALLMAPFAGEVIGWFSNDPQVIAIGRLALLFGCAVMPFMAYSTYVNQLSQVLGFRMGATTLACCRQGIFFFPSCLLGIFFGLPGLAAIQPMADFLTFVASVPYQIRFRKRHLSAGSMTASRK